MSAKPCLYCRELCEGTFCAACEEFDFRTVRERYGVECDEVDLDNRERPWEEFHVYGN